MAPGSSGGKYDPEFTREDMKHYRTATQPKRWVASAIESLDDLLNLIDREETVCTTKVMIKRNELIKVRALFLCPPYRSMSEAILYGRFEKSLRMQKWDLQESLVDTELREDTIRQYCVSRRWMSSLDFTNFNA